MTACFTSLIQELCAFSRADYWKSQPRKFCQYCKCWIADNKPSIEFHERGKNHKENVAAKISEIKKKSVEKAKKEERMSKEFAAMEEAALKAYEEDLKRMQRGSDGEDKEAGDALEEEKKETKPEEAAQRSGPKPETVAQVVTVGKTPVKRPRAANPYGAWERVQQKQDPL
uniref:Matrin-type domain-containing protein n=1 Tax=Xiphophorus couchianus TaxID=32473 RepID=A0A3B5MU61_9TELE